MSSYVQYLWPSYYLGSATSNVPSASSVDNSEPLQNEQLMIRFFLVKLRQDLLDEIYRRKYDFEEHTPKLRGVRATQTLVKKAMEIPGTYTMGDCYTVSDAYVDRLLILGTWGPGYTEKDDKLPPDYSEKLEYEKRLINIERETKDKARNPLVTSFLLYDDTKKDKPIRSYLSFIPLSSIYKSETETTSFNIWELVLCLKKSPVRFN
jgi:hypothetical protein